MSGAKETPRQKMIGMMYLVYTALLAMNVSKDILDAFDTVNSGVQTTNITLSDQINQKYAAFQDQYSKEPEKAGPYWEQAQSLKAEADDLINFIEALKWDLVRKVEEKTPYEALEHGLLKSADTIRNGRKIFDINTAKVKSRDNYNKPTAYMMGEPEGNGKAFELSEKIRRFRNEVVKVMGPEHIHEIGMITDSVYGPKAFVMEQTGASESQLKKLPYGVEVYGARMDYAPTAMDAIQKGWEYRNFHHTVLIADVTLLNKIISEAQTAELNAVIQLMTNIHASDYKFDEIGAKVFAESSYLLSGQTYKAQAMVTAWQNTQTKAYVKLDDGPEKEYTSDGQGVINLNYNCGVGQHRYTGYIKMLDPSTNEMKDFPFENSFVVAPPAVSVSATKMNVVYRGIDNPIAVGGGVGGEISATASNGNLVKTGNGTYNLRPGEGNEVTINVSSGGSSLGSMKFRVKDLPKPEALIHNVQNGLVTKSALLAANRVVAEMKDFDFDGVRYDVVGYTVRYKTKAGTSKEAKVTGAVFSEEVKNAISSGNVGDTYLFTAIQVRGNDGKTKTLETPIGVELK